MWNYRCHKILAALLFWPVTVCEFARNLSWEYARRNGNGPKTSGDFVECVRVAWERARYGD